MLGNRYTVATTATTIIEEKVTESLRYFNIFSYPLKIEEIYRFVSLSIPANELEEVLDMMVNKGSLYCYNGMYALEKPEQAYEKRKKGAEVAMERMTEAKKSAAIIARFPFVKSVCISGSLSKGYADEQSDIDFFIVTTHNRLWICRTLLHIFKKLTFLFNKEHSYCMNYFIDETMLCLEEKNRFTATELVTLIPMYNRTVYNRIIDCNKLWLMKFFPNVDFEPTGNIYTETERRKTIKSLAELVFNISWPEKLNLFLMNLTDKLWRRKWEKKNYPMEEYDLAMKTRWYVSKQHPLNYQKRVLEYSRK